MEYSDIKILIEGVELPAPSTMDIEIVFVKIFRKLPCRICLKTLLISKQFMKWSALLLLMLNYGMIRRENE